MKIELTRFIAKSEDTKQDRLRELAQNQDRQTRRSVARNPNIPIDILDKLSYEFPDEIVENPVFQSLLREDSQSHFVRITLARSSITSPGKLEELATVKDLCIAIVVAKNSNTSAKTLDRLASNICSEPRSMYLQICRAILRNRNTKTDTLRMLASSRYAKHRVVYAPLVSHPNVSSSVVEIAKFVNKNILPCTETLKQLANSPNNFIRQLVAEHTL